MIAKFIYYLSFLVLVSAYAMHATTTEEILATADSLFENKKYTESYDYYSELFFVQNIFSEQTLLKMAFIKEGLGEYDQAIFFLYKYYLLGYDKIALDKINKLAEEHQLMGFEADDVSYALGKLRQFYEEISFILLMLISFFVLILSYKKFRLHQKPFYTGIAALLFCVLLLLHNNLSEEPTEAIIIDDKSLLLEGPSSGANLVAIVGKGHKVDVLSYDPIWTQIKINESSVFTRSKNIQLIP